MPNLWKLNSLSNDYTPFVYANEQDVEDKIFSTNGQPKNWLRPPCLQAYLEKDRKNQAPLADFSYITAGSVVLNARACAVLQDFLSPFGQLLQVQCLNAGNLSGNGDKISEIYYLYNVTNLISCIDAERSEKRGSGIIKPTYFNEMIPQDAQIFKDPLRARHDIYLSTPAKERLMQLIASAQLTGAQISPA